MTHRRRRSPKQTFGVMSVVLTGLVGYAAYAWLHQFGLHWYWVLIISLSVVTFIWYGFDKAQSKRGGERVPEIVLQLLTLAGGFPGGWLGRLVFHHKTKHSSFLIVLILSTVLHVGLAPTLLAM